MRKFLTTILFVAAMSWIAPCNAAITATIGAAPEKSEQLNGNNASDTTKKVAKELQKANAEAKKLHSYINKRLSDTIVNYSTAEGDEENTPQKKFEFTAQVDDNGVPASVIAIVAIMFGSIFLIIVAIFVFNYLFRRQKYKVIEKAIENDYPLPAGTFGGAVRQVQQPLAATGNTTQPMTASVAEWGTMKSGIKWTAWGIGITLFFLFQQETIAAIGLIPLIIGLGKLYVAYKNNRTIDSISAGKTYQMPTPPPFSPKEQPQKSENGTASADK